MKAFAKMFDEMGDSIASGEEIEHVHIRTTSFEVTASSHAPILAGAGNKSGRKKGVLTLLFSIIISISANILTDYLNLIEDPVLRGVISLAIVLIGIFGGYYYYSSN